ncbi:MAG: hypothetical protein R3C18_00160 [Planctomycetaceae bacterium]
MRSRCFARRIDSVIARCKHQFFFDPIHYLGLLERKPGGFDHARSFEEWELPVCFGILRRRLETELDELGTKEFIKILRLLERHSLSTLKSAVQHALEIGASSADAIRLILEYRRYHSYVDGLLCFSDQSAKAASKAATEASADANLASDCPSSWCQRRTASALSAV